MPNGRSGERTRTHYKHRFFERVMASAPGAILEVGCGRGAFLKEATRRGCRVIGLEADNELVMELQEAGIGAQLGRAEELPFKDASFDVVVFQYVLHHCENLAQALGEAVRVARRGVFVLEAWYDQAIPSQRVALSFDRWSKTIDRRTGIVNNEFPNANDLLASIPGAKPFLIEYTYQLLLRLIQMDTVRSIGEAQLARIGDDPILRRQLEAILDEARQFGISDDGALSMQIRKS